MLNDIVRVTGFAVSEWEDLMHPTLICLFHRSHVTWMVLQFEPVYNTDTQ